MHLKLVKNMLKYVYHIRDKISWAIFALQL